jgi:acyl-CoA hydrolase
MRKCRKIREIGVLRLLPVDHGDGSTARFFGTLRHGSAAAATQVQAEVGREKCCAAREVGGDCIQMKFFSRKWIKPEDLNSNGTLFGGRLLAWIDEEAAIYAMCQLGNNRHLVTKFISEIDFVASAQQGEVIEIGVELVSIGRSSITMRAEVRNKATKQTIISIKKIVFVNLDANGKAVPHGVAPMEVPVDA